MKFGRLTIHIKNGGNCEEAMESNEEFRMLCMSVVRELA